MVSQSLLRTLPKYRFKTYLDHRLLLNLFSLSKDAYAYAALKLWLLKLLYIHSNAPEYPFSIGFLTNSNYRYFILK